MRTQIFNALKITALAITLSFGISYVYAWTAPTVSPTGGNVSAPINTSTTAQIKTGSLGIGNIVTPGYNLDVRGAGTKVTTQGFANIFQVGSTVDANPLALRFGIKTDATATNRYGALEVDDDGIKRALVLQQYGGNVGIGTTNPAQKLDVRGGATKVTNGFFENIFQVASTDATNPLALRFGIQTNPTATNRYGALEVDDAGTKRNLVLQPSSGNVGIGTTATTQMLTVAGTIGATGDICTTTGGITKCLSTPASVVPHGTAGAGGWVAPAGVTKVFVTAVGGGGGGGGSTTWNGQCSGYGGGGGGAGAFAFKNLVTVTPGTTYTLVAGTAGTAGYLLGLTGNGYPGGTGGVSGISGVFTVDGGTGGAGPWSSGGCAGYAGTGGTGSSKSIYLGGIVAGSSGTPSNGAASGGAAGVSIVGPDYGSGGNGAPINTNNAYGTAGKPGFVLVEW